MKKFLHLFISAVMLLSASSLFAATKIGDLYYNFNTSAKTASVTSNPNSYAGKIVIPGEVEYNNETYTVTSIASSAFKDCSNLTAVTIQEGVTAINNEAFQNCSSLGSVTFPNTLKSIDNNAFAGCTGLLSIEMPNSVTNLGGGVFSGCSSLKTVQLSSALTSIPSSAFHSCRALESIEIPNGVKSIDSYAFRYCEFKSVTIPSSLTSVGIYAFENNSNNVTHRVYISDLSAWCKIAFSNVRSNPCYYGAHLYLNGEEITDLVIPAGITAIKANAFYGCKYIKSLTIPEGVTNIGANAFSYCAGLSTVVLPNSMENVATEAFSSCSNLASVTVGTNMANIHQTTFSSCTNLNTVVWNAKTFTDFGNATLSPFYTLRNQIRSFTFGESVEHIPAYLCYEMNNLAKIDIPANVTSVGEGAFAFCGRLAEINAAAGSPLYTSVDGVLYNKDKTTLIIYPAGKSATSFSVPNTVTRIEDNAFYGCANLSSVEVPASVKEIGKGNTVIPMWSFQGAVPATIPAESAFADDVYLITDDVEAYKAAWPDYASRIFPRTYAVQSLTLEAKSDKSALHMAIGDANLENVVKLTIKGTINSYDLMIMRNKMINLRELDLTDATVLANEYEYYTGICSHADTLLSHSFRYVVSLKLPKTLKYIENAVEDCGQLKYLEINGGVVGPNMAPSTGLEVVLNEGVSALKADAFKGKTGLKKISMYGPITTIPAKSFQGCISLQEAILPASLVTIGNYAFNGSGLLSVTIPANVKSIGEQAFSPSRYYYGNNYYYRYQYGSDNAINYIGGNYENYRYENPSSLSKLIIEPESQLRTIGQEAFFACPIDSVLMPDSVRTIGNYAFCNCRNLKCVAFTDESKLTSIGTAVFQQCGSLDSLRLPASLQSIGELAFSIHDGSFMDISDAELKVFLPEALTTVGKGAFYGRKHITKVAYPGTLKSIARDAFRKCEGLTYLSFPTSLQTIGDYAFEGGKGLEDIRVPSTLLSVGDYAFDNCSDVTRVYTYTVEPVQINQNTFSCWHNADLYVPATSYYTYYYNTQWSQFLSLKTFDEEYTYFYINNDYELGGGNGTIDGTPDADLNENSGLIVSGDDAQEIGTITVNGDDTGAASIIACDNNLLIDSLVIQLRTKKNHWSYFCFPFDVALTQLRFAHQYVIREYDGDIRAQHGAGGWVNFSGQVLQKGKGYIFQGAKTDTLFIQIKTPVLSCADFNQIIVAHSSGNSINSNWNFIGNPFPSWYKLDALFEAGFKSAIYIWDALLSDYKVYMPGDDDYDFHPYEGFFTQNPAATDGIIVWPSNGRETKNQVDQNNKQNNAPARAMRQASQQRKLINLQLVSDTYTDQTRIVFNESADLSYELGSDAAKMDGGAPLHIWSIADNNRLAINERPYDNGQVSLGYDVKEEGHYTLSAARMDTAVIIYDNELNQEVDLSLGDYHFFTAAGTNTTRFSIVRVKEADQTATSIDNVEIDLNERVNVYNLLGTRVLENVRRGDIQLSTGVYVIESANGARAQINIK